MSIKLDGVTVLLGPGGEPADSADCCCGQSGCEPCVFRLDPFDVSGLNNDGLCGAPAPSADPAWDGSFCQFFDGGLVLYASNPFPFVNPNLSINGFKLAYVWIYENSPGVWRMEIVCDTTNSIWYGDLTNVTPDGVYVRNVGSCSNNPASFTVVTC